MLYAILSHGPAWNLYGVLTVEFTKSGQAYYFLIISVVYTEIDVSKILSPFFFTNIFEGAESINET